MKESAKAPTKNKYQEKIIIKKVRLPSQGEELEEIPLLYEEGKN